MDSGKELVKIARNFLKSYLKDEHYFLSEEQKKKYSEKRGIFVTIHKNNNLRGCIGFIEPIYPLYKGLLKAASSAATDDPRFPAMSYEELETCTIEVSVLTTPQLIEVEIPEEYFEEIEIGRDGLIFEGVFGKGLLLPVVALEWGWGPKQFLEAVCQKSGAVPDAWQDLKNKIHKFQTEVFSEKEPEGDIEKRL